MYIYKIGVCDFLQGILKKENIFVLNGVQFGVFVVVFFIFLLNVVRNLEEDRIYY